MKARISTENYLKTILILQKKSGGARSVDVADMLQVSKPSVSAAVKKLCGRGLLTIGENHALTLTPAGLLYAAAVLERHTVIENILVEICGVGQETAHQDSCGLEHFISTETFLKIKAAYESHTRTCTQKPPLKKP